MAAASGETAAADTGTSVSFQPFGSPAEGASTAPSPLSPNGLVSNVFVDTSIREALADIASQTGEIIVPDNSVQGVVTCDLKDVPLEKALRIVLSVGNYAWKRMDGFILVGSCDQDGPTFGSFSETRMVKLDHLPAKAAVSMLSPAMQKLAKAMEPDPKGNGNGSANMVCITAPPEVIERMEAALRQMDQAPRQVMLDARMVVLEEGDLLNLGVQWDWPQVVAGAFTDSDQNKELRKAGTPAWPWGLRVGYTPGREFTNALLLTLNLLATNDEATVLASPQVVAQDGKEAEISVINEEYFDIVTQGYYTQSQLEKIQAGTVLKITPRVCENGDIIMDISTEVSDVVGRGQSNLPVVTRRTAKSTLRVEDGGTAAVAGLMDSRTRQNNVRVPYLSRIPLLGYLFRNTARTYGDRQVAVFITARLMADGLEAPKREPAPALALEPERDDFVSQLADCLHRRGGKR